MAFYEIKIDEAQINAVVRRLGAYRKQLPTVMRNAVNDTTTSARSEIIKEIGKKTKIKREVIGRRISYKKATLLSWAAWLRVKDYPISMANFRARQVKEGVSFVNPKTAKREVFKRAFLAKVGKVELAWVREAKGLNVLKYDADTMESNDLVGETLVSRKPIMPLFGPSLSYFYQNIEGLASSVLSNAGIRLKRNLIRQIDRATNKIKIKKK